jgi:hypothetical protein
VRKLTTGPSKIQANSFPESHPSFCLLFFFFFIVSQMAKIVLENLLQRSILHDSPTLNLLISVSSCLLDVAAPVLPAFSGSVPSGFPTHLCKPAATTATAHNKLHAFQQTFHSPSTFSRLLSFVICFPAGREDLGPSSHKNNILHPNTTQSTLTPIS